MRGDAKCGRSPSPECDVLRLNCRENLEHQADVAILHVDRQILVPFAGDAIAPSKLGQVLAIAGWGGVAVGAVIGVAGAVALAAGLMGGDE